MSGDGKARITRMASEIPCAYPAVRAAAAARGGRKIFFGKIVRNSLKTIVSGASFPHFCASFPHLFPISSACFSPKKLRKSRLLAPASFTPPTAGPFAGVPGAPPLRVRRRRRSKFGILGHQLCEHAVRPSEADLHRIFPAAAGASDLARAALDIELLEKRARARVGLNIGSDPAARDLAGEIPLAVSLEPLDRHILQRRPTVRPVPLLTGLVNRRGDAARLQEPPAQFLRDGVSLIGRRDPEEERRSRRRRLD